MLGSISNPINESVERKEGTLNRIVDFMVQDTTWDIFMERENVRVDITFPDGDISEYSLNEMEVDWEQFFINESDMDYIINNFGITEKWIIQELYNRFINKLRPIIYEEMINFGEGNNY